MNARQMRAAIGNADERTDSESGRGRGQTARATMGPPSDERADGLAALARAFSRWPSRFSGELFQPLGRFTLSKPTDAGQCLELC